MPQMASAGFESGTAWQAKSCADQSDEAHVRLSVLLLLLELQVAAPATFGCGRACNAPT
jgi:hypothetical protein